ncbi:MAG: hypothetical protein H6696_09095 [Deferribacteres bacterium]|nr:hypothetical protein [candidate division KSB1 bacterium]MCB9502081.1 hypothetical protein [Deferribacteres bacterium]
MTISIVRELPIKGELNLKTWQLFIIIAVANLVIAWVWNQYILTRDVYYNLLADQLEANRIDEYFDLTRKFTLWAYLFQPALLWMQIIFFTLLLQTPLMLLNIEIPFNQIFRIVLIASLATTALALIQLLKLSFYPPEEITANVLNIVPFSTAELVEMSEYPLTSIFMLNKFNPFEFLWTFLLYKELVNTKTIKKESSLIIVFGLWLVIVLFQWGIVAYFSGVNG